MRRRRQALFESWALSHFGVDRQHLGWLIDELVVGAHRLKLIDQPSQEVRASENAANAKWEEIAERQVRTPPRRR